MCVSNTLECPEGSLKRQFPPTPSHLSKHVTLNPFSDIFLTAVIPEGLLQLLLYFS